MKLKSAMLCAAAVLAACMVEHPSFAEVTPLGWWHYGEVPDYYADSSGNGHRFGLGFSSCGGVAHSGQAGAVVAPFGVGGPLGPTGFTSTGSLRWGAEGCSAAGMWSPGFNPPGTNYGIELWVLPNNIGVLGGSSTWIFGSGSSGGVSFRITNNPDDGTSSIGAFIIGSNLQIGDSVPADTNRWTHLAVVNVDGVSTFYVDGVPHGAPDVGHSTVPAGDIFGGSSPGTTPTFDGWLDELRIFSFAPGQFSTNDLLLRAPGPNIVAQPQSAVVWEGGAAPFQVQAAIDSSLTYQWKRDGTIIPDATSAEYYLPVVTPADNGAVFSVALQNAQGTLTSSNATLSVVPVQTANLDYYRQAILGESSLVAYFPVDGNTGTVITNLVDPAFNGAIEGSTEYDSRTNRSFGERALRLKGDGDVTIPNNPAYEFADGNGTVEALVYLERANSANNETIFSIASGTDSIYYALQASADGSSLYLLTDPAAQPLGWAIPVPILNRFAHVAAVFADGTITAYVDGQSLGTKTNGLGVAVGSPANIGSIGYTYPGAWTGTIDEVAIYNAALSANTLAIHNTRFINGTNVTAPAIVSQPLGARTLLAGGSPTFTVSASGTAPLTYQWSFKGAPIEGATSATLELPATTVASSGNYSVKVTNPIGSATGQDFTVNFVSPEDSYATIVMGDHPSAYWRLAETNGATAFDSAGAHDGSYSGAVSQGAPGALPGIANTAASFVGLGDGKVSIPYSSTLNPSTAFSIEYWANPNTHTPSGQTYVPMGSQLRNGAARLGWAFYMENSSATGWEIQMGDATGVHADVFGGDDVPGRYDHIVAVYDGAGTVQLYVNNTLAGTGTGGYVPNPSQPWIIGQRNDGVFGFDGKIDEVAFYNYALSDLQISNHFSIAFVAPVIVTAPTNVPSALEAGNVTLSIVASGYPNTYQWFKDGVALDDTSLNPDNSIHFQGFNSTNLVITQATPSDSGKYHVVITNPLGLQTSADATVTVGLDTSAPTVAYVTATGTNRVRVVFNRPMSDAANAASYSINNGVTVSEAIVPNTASINAPTVVDLVTSPLAPGQSYTLIVSGVHDTRISQNLIATNSTLFTAYVLTPGLLAWDFYAGIPNNSVEDLLLDPQYPNAVNTNLFLTNFSTSPITGGDLANNPGFGSLGNNYGSHIYGWITPAESGNYTFFIRSDDGSRLWLSTDSNPDNATEIAREDNCCNGFQEPGDEVTQTSAPIALQANQPYYIEAYQKEGGGGDFLEVAWRKEGDSTPAASLQPIPGAFLSAFAPVAPANLELNMPVFSNGNVSITWTGDGTLQESTDLKNWSLVAGNPVSGFTVTPTAGSHKFYRLIH